MKYFLDTEFLEGPQQKHFLGIPCGTTKPTIDLISIGIVAEDGREFYAISKDFNLKEAWNRFQYKERTNVERSNGFDPQKEYWIRENVLKQIFIELWEDEKQAELTKADFNSGVFNFKTFKRLIHKYGKTNQKIAQEIQVFTTQYSENKEEIWSKPEFYAYYADYDWVVFCWIFGRMIDLPNGFPMYCKDLKQILDEKVNKVFIDDGKGGDLINGRLDWIKTLPHYPKQKNEHNALDDAKWNLELYKFLESL